MGLPRGGAFDARKGNVFRHQLLPAPLAPMDYAIAGENGARRVRCLAAQPLIERRERLVRFVEQLLERVDDEIGLLIRIDAEFGRQHAFEIEGDAVGLVAVDGIDGLALRREDAGAIDAQTFGVRMRPNSIVYQ